ncbi:MAG: hypothetical protein IKQ55_12210 [Kiritimatiellae bacterium]|nr:hypothetical protein [Kiritimatiellia bacterium]
MRTPSPRLRRILWLLLAALIATGAVATRRHVFNAQRALTPDGEVPFTLESALAYRRIQLAYRDGALPSLDRAIGWPDGIDTRATDSSGAEYALAAAARAWPGTLPLADKIRWLELLWFCTVSVAGLFCLVRWAGGGWAGGAVAAAFWAVSISAVARSTGQELSHENDALPLVVWSLAFMARLWRGRATARSAALSGWLSALLMAAALCLWDLVQYALGLVALTMLVTALAGRLDRRRWLHGAIPLAACLTAVAASNPYLRAHGFWGSPVFGAVWAAVFTGIPMVQRGRWWERVGAAATVLAATIAASSLFASSYSHFGALLAAKLRFLNCRPDDPALLTFEQRILWAPALNSTSWMSVWEWFPALLLLSALAIPAARFALRPSKTDTPFLAFLSASWLVSLLAFILFFRFHVWLSLFACILVGLAAGALWPRTGFGGRLTTLVLLLAAFGIELSQPCITPLRWGRPYTYPAESEALMDHLRRYVAPEPVAANFGLSGAIAAYGGCPVVLHPKFETPTIRRDVEAYGTALFRGTEADFRDWMVSKGATVYVHSMGEFSDVLPGLQMRYMVDALNPATNAAARLFEQRPEELQHFTPQFANIKYRVYRLKTSPSVAADAGLLAARAAEAFETGRLDAASLWAAHALRLDPAHLDAATTLRHASALSSSGVQPADADGNALSLDEDPAFPLDDDGLAPPIAPAAPPWPWPLPDAPSPAPEAAP